MLQISAAIMPLPSGARADLIVHLGYRRVRRDAHSLFSRLRTQRAHPVGSQPSRSPAALAPPAGHFGTATVVRIANEPRGSGLRSGGSERPRSATQRSSGFGGFEDTGIPEGPMAADRDFYGCRQAQIDGSKSGRQASSKGKSAEGHEPAVGQQGAEGDAATDDRRKDE